MRRVFVGRLARGERLPGLDGKPELHPLRYRMDALRKQTGRHPDDPQQRMELWLAIKARQALAAREASEEHPAHA